MRFLIFQGCKRMILIYRFLVHPLTRYFLDNHGVSHGLVGITIVFSIKIQYHGFHIGVIGCEENITADLEAIFDFNPRFVSNTDALSFGERRHISSVTLTVKYLSHQVFNGGVGVCIEF